MIAECDRAKPFSDGMKRMTGSIEADLHSIPCRIFHPEASPLRCHFVLTLTNCLP